MIRTLLATILTLTGFILAEPAEALVTKAVCVLAALVIAILTIRARFRASVEAVRMRFDARMQERTRVARDLHDTLMQTVLASKLIAEEAHRAQDDLALTRAAVERLARWLKQAEDEGRAAVDALRSTLGEDDDLGTALRFAFADSRIDAQVDPHFVVTGRQRPLQPLVREQVFQIGVEAIRNVCLHANAHDLFVTLDYGAALTLVIQDNGSGIAPSILRSGKSGHFGLVGMRERAEQIGARLTVENGREGARVKLAVPGRMIYQQSGLRSARYKTWIWQEPLARLVPVV